MEEKQGLFGSSLRSLVFRPGDSSSSSTGGGSGVAERKIQWRLGNLIGRGAFGSVYMGFNVDSGELLAVKQVLIGTNNASKEKAQERILELEEEVKLLKGLSHPNIVRYLGTAREKDTFNILLEYVPGGSITSLLGKFGSFSEPVIRTYTKQLLQGLQYLHHNNIIHRDIKGANILVDDKGCIKVADFGASKQVAQLATITAAMSVKGTPYWMAPEVIVETGHSFSADIWSVGCTVIEMATGERPWSQHYEEVAVLFHVGETKAHPPIPSKLSSIAKDFLLKCFQQEPHARPTAADLLQHPFVTGENQDPHQLHHSSVVKPSACGLLASRPSTLCGGLKDADYGGESCSTMCPEKLFRSRPMWETSTDDDMCRFNDSDDICRLGDKDDFPVVGSGFNPMSEPLDHWSCKSSPGPVQRFERPQFNESYNSVGGIMKGEKDLTFPCVPMPENESEVTETKVRAFLDQKEIAATPLVSIFEHHIECQHFTNCLCMQGKYYKFFEAAS